MPFKVLIFTLIALLLTACSGGAADPPATLANLDAALAATALARTPTAAPPTFTPESTEPPATEPPTDTPAPPATNTPPPTLTPTFQVLRGLVIPERVNCRYGPGAVYLYKYGLLAGTPMEIIGRREDAAWVLIQAVGGNNPCWVNAELLDFDGDLMTVAPVDVHVVLAWSPFYDALTGVSAARDGDTVTVFWNLLQLRAGDDSGQTPYVVEAWVCQAGEIIFEAIGSWTFAADVTDERSCDEASYVRVFAAEKHGYTKWVVVPWPPHPEP
jgi:hypothetical protein